jgi:hypothetical protein
MTEVNHELCGVLQDCMGLVEGETGYCSDTCVTGGVVGTGDGNVQVEETVAIRGEISEAVKFPAINAEHEVRLQGLHEIFPTHAVRLFIALRRKF